MKLNSFIKYLTATTFSVTLVACGGDDDSNETIQPTLELGQNKTFVPQKSVGLTPYHIDFSATPVTYTWTQESGTPVELSGENSVALKFMSPEPSDTPLVFKLVVVDAEGNSAEDTISINVNHEYVGNYQPVQRVTYSDAGVAEFCEAMNYDGFFTFVNTDTTPGSDGVCFTDDDVLPDSETSTELDMERSAGQIKTTISQLDGENAPVTCETFFNILTSLTWESYSLDTEECKDDLSYTNTSSYSTINQIEDGFITRADEITSVATLDAEDKIVITDTIDGYVAYTYATDGQIDETNSFSSFGADEAWFTADDPLVEKTVYNYDTEGYLDHVVVYSAADGEMYTSSAIVMVTKYEHVDGLLTEFTDYSSAGDDGDWFTYDDNTVQQWAKLKRSDIYPLTAKVLE